METSSTEPSKSHGGSRRFVRIAAPLVAAAAIGAGVAVAVDSSTGGGSQSAAVTPTLATQPAALAKTLSAEAIYDRTAPGVVELEVSSSAGGVSPFGDPQAQGEGSGFVIDKQGRIVTNAHVVEGATSITVKFHDGSTAKATLVGSDPSTDVAVVKVNGAASKLKPLTLGDSSEAEASSPSAARSGWTARSPRVLSAPSTDRSRRLTAAASAASSRRTPRSTRATRAARC
jgi:S1-C subfamily serine protease